jgi:hypothetical protein
MGGFMVRRAPSTTTARPATIETTISSSNRNGKANSQVGLVFLSQEENTVLAFKCRTASLKCTWAELLFERIPCYRLEQIYFLAFVFLVRAADP